jgi:hypothetical protein
MLLHDNPDPRAATGRLFSTMMVTIILLTTLAVVALGPQSGNHEAFSGRTPSTSLDFAE